MRVDKHVDNVQNPSDSNEYYRWEIISFNYAIFKRLNNQNYIPFFNSRISRP